MWNECRKQYYFHYIKIYDGLPNDKNKQILWDLRKMQRLVFLKGRLIHHAIKEHISSISKGGMKEDDVVEFFLKSLNSNMEAREKNITEIYNGFPIGEKDLKAVEEDGTKQLKNFCNTIWPDYKDAKYLGHEQLTNFSVDGINIWIAIDLLTEKDGFHVITDWKTGTEGYIDVSDSNQLGTYILWANRMMNIIPEKIRGEIVYLRSAKKETTQRTG